MTPNNRAVEVISASVLMTVILTVALFAHLVPALLAGLLAFTLAHRLIAVVQRHAPDLKFPERLVSLTVGLSSLLLLAVAGLAVARLLKGENLSGLLMTLAQTLEHSKQYLPPDMSAQIPHSVIELKQAAADIAKKHAASVASFGTHTLHTTVLVLVGWIVGSMTASRTRAPLTSDSPAFYAAWRGLWQRFSGAFELVAFAQIKVAAFNSMCMAAFLFLLCPVVGWDIPYSKTLVVATFLCGLIPVLGNLLSNTLTAILALTVSLPAASAVLAYLVIIHKLEYIILSKALGAETGTEVEELLIVLFAAQVLVGTAGMVLSPVIYTFLRCELRRNGWLPIPKVA